MKFINICLQSLKTSSIGIFREITKMIFVILLKLIHNMPIVNLCRNRKGVEMEQINGAKKYSGIEQSAGEYIKKKWNEESKDVNSDVQNVMADISDNLYNPTKSDYSLFLADDNLWSFNDDDDEKIDKNEYSDIFTQLSDIYGVDIDQSNLDVLFDILDVDDDGTLSKGEYEFLMYKNGITGYSLIHALGTRDDNIADHAKSNASSIYKGAISFADSEEKESLLDKVKEIYGEDSEEYKAVSNADENEKIKVSDLEDDEIKKLAEKLFQESDSSIKDYKSAMTNASYIKLEEMVKELKAEATETEQSEEETEHGSD